MNLNVFQSNGNEGNICFIFIDMQISKKYTLYIEHLVIQEYKNVRIQIKLND